MSENKRHDVNSVLGRITNTAVLAITLLACSGCQTLSHDAPPVAEIGADGFERDLSIARLAERHGDEDKAQQIYRSILAHDAQNQEALHRMGVIAAREGRMTSALTFVESAMVSGPPSAELLGDLGYVYYKQKKYSLAEDKFNESLDLDPRNERSLNNLGLVLAAQKKYGRALALFEQVGTQAEALANLAYAQTQLGDLKTAESNYHLALEADPKTKVAAVGLIELRKHMRMNRARGYRQPASQIARSERKMAPAEKIEPLEPLNQTAEIANAELRKRAITAIAEKKPNWRTAPAPTAPAPSNAIQTRVASSRKTFPEIREPRVDQAPVEQAPDFDSIVEATTEPAPPIVPSPIVPSPNPPASSDTRLYEATVASPPVPQPSPVQPMESTIHHDRNVMTVSHTQDVQVEDSQTTAVLNAPPPQPAPMQPITSELPQEQPERVVFNNEWPDNLGLVLSPAE